MRKEYSTKYSKYKDLILSLHEEGYTTGVIANIVSDKTGEKILRSAVLRLIKRTLGDKYAPNSSADLTEARIIRKEYKDTKHDKETKNRIDEIMEESGVINGLHANAHMVWDKSDKRYSIMYKMVKDIMTFDQMQEALKEDLKQYTPNLKPIKRGVIKDPHLLVIDVADLHIGKLADDFDTGDTYNHDIAFKRAIEGVEGLLAKASGFPIDKILFITGDDVLHVDNEKKQTTGGTPQDVSQKWYRSFILARKLYVKIIERLLSVADLHIIYDPSNHDYISGFMLVDAVWCWFNKCENITWDITTMHRKYFQYGNSLIGTTHGDGGKLDNLPLSMSMEAKDYWSSSKYYYWYLHHLHHKQKYKFSAGKDMQGVSIEYLRSPSGTDSWHSKNQYANNFKAVEGFIHSKKFGQVARLTHLF